MRALLAILLLSLPLCAQEAAKPAEQAKPEEKKEAAAAAQDQTAAAAAGGGELSITGSVDVGYRWVTSGGNFQTYRSIINLGGGPKLFGADATVLDPKKRLFDRLDVHANNWGGDPYNTILVTARKMGVYDLRADYRNIIYYNFLPSFADPTSAFGSFLNQRSYDIHKRTTDVQLDLRPGKSIVPFLAYGRNSNSGRGVTTFVSTGDEFPVTNRVRDSLDNYRGGLRFELRRWHLTVEEGGTVVKDDQQVFTSNFNPGNALTPFLGQQLSLSNLRQAYGVRGHSTYSKVLASGNPFPWISLFGQFIFSQPQTDVHYSQNNAGNFVTLNPLLFFNAEVALFSGTAKMPHTSANAGFEIRPLKRLRIIESWMTDRLHNAPFGVLTDRLLGGGAGATGTVLVSEALQDHLVTNYSQQQTDAFYDLTKWLTLRGGYRYVWGDAKVPPTALTPAGERGEERRHVGIAGLMFRISRKLQANAEVEAADSEASYFRTSLNNYQWLRSQIKYQATDSLQFSANVNVLNNENPVSGIKFNYLSRQTGFSVLWTPNGGKRVDVIATYMRSTFRSDTVYLEPSTLTPVPFLYRENAHTGDALVEVSLPAMVAGKAPKVSFGGSFYKSAGSRPTAFYQPVGRLAVPFHKNLAWVSEYRYHGYGEPFFVPEGFRAHLFTTGLRFSR